MSSGTIRWFAPAMLAAVAVTALAPRAKAMPMFARKYNMQCAQCHTMPPRLTPFGYKFLRSGYRLAGAEEQAPSPTNALFFNTQVTASNTHFPGDSASDTRGFDSSGSEIQLVTPIGENLAAKFAYSFPGDGPAGIDESWLQYNNNKPEAPIMTLKAGQLPVMSGFELGGARSITLTDPLMFGSAGPFQGDTGNFSLSGLERGLEFGVTQGPVTGKVSWLNGVNQAGEGAVGLNGKRAKDFALQGEYLFGETGSHIGAIVYSGNTPMLDYENKFNRAAVFGTYAYPLKAGEKTGEMTLELNGAYLWGKDRIPDLSSEATPLPIIDAKSKGALIELSLYQPGKTAFSLRYDTLKPSDVSGTLTTKATTFAASHLLTSNLRLAAELRKQTKPDTDSFIVSAWLLY